MRRVGWLALLLALACESPPAAPPPEPSTIEETSTTTSGPLTVSTRRVREPGWSGRLIVVTLERTAARRLTVAPSERPRPLSEIVAGLSPPQPFAAICGGFYDPSGDPMGLVRSDARDLAPLSERGGSGVLVVEGGEPRVVPAGSFTPSDRLTDALQSIDRLVAGGRALVGDGASDRRAARSAIALGATGAVRLAIAFADDAVASEDDAQITLGPATATTGPTIAEWAALLRRPDAEGGVGAEDALNLDGGYSTSLLVKSDALALRVVAARATINAVIVSYGEER